MQQRSVARIQIRSKTLLKRVVLHLPQYPQRFVGTMSTAEGTGYWVKIYLCEGADDHATPFARLSRAPKSHIKITSNSTGSTMTRDPGMTNPIIRETTRPRRSRNLIIHRELNCDRPRESCVADATSVYTLDVGSVHMGDSRSK
jgi:hypothetical protein